VRTAGCDEHPAVPLDTIVARLAYRPGWTFKIAGPLGSALCVFARTPDSAAPARERTTQHQFPIPAGPLPACEWLRWIRGCLELVERHELGEFLTFDGRRPFFPHHQDEGSPYELVDRCHDPKG
jgi:hypothetical protein